MNDLRNAHGNAGLTIEHAPVTVAVDSVCIEGDMSVPTEAKGAVLFARQRQLAP